ncbi:hypothetical protein KEM48_010198 [Puccinia striiformis f. sp. tritici PST-130]|nr:hypothetical protein KEM48_010198 [Puccinia striiformis f. sp. tritici PST-130]
MKEPGVDLTDFINVLEDICIKTRLGRRRFPPRNSPQTAKDSVVPVNKPKAPTTLITCFVCNRARHTSRNCPKKVHNLQEDKPPEDKELSKYEPDGPIIGDESRGAHAIGLAPGRNNLVRIGKAFFRHSAENDQLGRDSNQRP